MKKVIIWFIPVLLFSSNILMAQEGTDKEERLSYYEQRAREDAQYEQSLALEEDEAADFWKDQERYEKELKKKDRSAYKAYMKGKRDAYAEHYDHCDHHCHHGNHYYYHATFYYHGYHRDYYYRNPPRSSIRTGIRVGTPSVRVGIL